MKTSSMPNGQWFDEDESWVMMGDLINALRSFAQRNLVHGDIQPQNVFIMKDNHLKLIDSAFVNEFESGYKRKLNDDNYYSPLSPSALISVAKRVQKPQFDKMKNDVWSAGITILCA